MEGDVSMHGEPKMNKRPLNVGLLAHVDAGKTTLSEALLYVSGARRVLGRVDHGDAYLDTDRLEREITIFSKQARLETKTKAVTLVDTPGAITGSIAWIYYAGYTNWVTNSLNASMQKIKEQAIEYLPKEFVDIAEEFSDVCGKRAGTYYRVGMYTSILNYTETEKFWTDWDGAATR